jgi:hypothetical protein
MSARFYVGLVVALFLLGSVEAKWGLPLEILSYEDPMRITKSLYTDAGSGMTHMVYCNSSDGYIYYTRLDESGLMLSELRVLVNDKRCYQVELRGLHDGNTIFLAFESRRSMSLEECTMANLGGCDEIFVATTLDSGSTWSAPKPIEVAPSSAIRRRVFTFLPNWRSKYFWLMYMKFVGNEKSLAGVKYDISKGEFGREHILLQKYADLQYYPTLTFDSKGAAVLKLLYASQLSLALQTVFSTDDGNTWTKGESLKNVCGDSKYVVRKLESRGSYWVAECMANDIVKFSFSQDQGKTWTQPISMESRTTHELAFCSTDEVSSIGGYWTTLSNRRKTMYVTYGVIPEEKVTYGGVPDAFYFVPHRMNMNCYFQNGNLKVRFLYHIRSTVEGHNKYTLYIIENDNVQESVIPTPKTDL